MAQQANPKPIGQIDDSRAQLSTRSMFVVMKLSSNRWSMSPMLVPLLLRFLDRNNPGSYR